jgi:hypothetical protein
MHSRLKSRSKSALGSAKLVAKNHYTHEYIRRDVVNDGGVGGSNLHGAQFNLSLVIYKGDKFAERDKRRRPCFFLRRAHA